MSASHINPTTSHKQEHPLLKASTINAIKPDERTHFLKQAAVRHTMSLGDMVGLSHLGVHLSRLKPGSESSELHWHSGDEEWIYILSGHGKTILTKRDADRGVGWQGRTADEVEIEELDVGPGDFMGFKRNGRAHTMKNTGDEDLVYLLGGERNSHDHCSYPKLGKTLFIERDSAGTQGVLMSNTSIEKTHGSPRKD
ncbi:RmlC-like cupin domain-containing protein [Phlyctochytrium arcticum]|nr:RmlC-like cupin domain-containing protein [Phlyctochytrium arcticum]